jgi:hypothetical protein
MEYDKDIVVEAKRQLAVLAIKHLKKVDARTLTVFQKHNIFDSLESKVNYEEILPILENPEHLDRRPIGSGPLFCFLAKKDPPEANVVNMADLLFGTNIILRKASLDYFNSIEDGEIPFLTSKSRGILKTLGEALLSDDKQKWRDAAITIYDALEEDWYCNYAALRQCLSRNFIPGVEHYLTKTIRPTIPSVESVTPGVWETSKQKEKIQAKIEQIVADNSNIVNALNKYFMVFGHMPLALDLSTISLVNKWQSVHGNIENIWDTLWAWADSFELPLPRYHVCIYFISNPNLVPEAKYKDLWHEIAEIVFLSDDEEAGLKWTQSWKMFCDIARHYCCHLETHLPYMNGEKIASQAWWLALQMCKAFTSEKEAVKHLRKETFLPELTNSSRIWEIASPFIQPSSLRFLTLNTQSIFALSLQSVLGNNIESLNPKSMCKEDFKKIENAMIGVILAVYPPVLKTDSEKIYAFDDSPLIMAKKWVSYIDKDNKQEEMINAFIIGIEKLMKSESLSGLLNRFVETHSGDQILIANYFKNMVFTEEVSLDEIWKVIDDFNWREAAFGKSHPMNLPHFYALECEKCEDKKRKEYLFACTIRSSLCGNTISGIQRLLKGENKHSYQDYINHWRTRLEDTHKWAPEWVKARIRPVLAMLHL